MSVPRNAAACAAACAGACLVMAASAASAAPLAMVNVDAPAINCVFDSSCKVVATDSIGGSRVRLRPRSAACSRAPGRGRRALPATA